MRLTSVISYSPRAEGLSALGDLDDARIVKIEAGHRPVRLGSGGFLFDRYGSAGGIEFNHPVALRIGHVIGEHSCALIASRRPAKLLAQTRAVENVVAKDEHRRLAADERLADNESLRQPVRLGLLRIVDPDAPFRAIAKQAAKHRQIVRRRNDQRLADPGEHDDRQRIIDHRLVVDGDELLRDRKRDRMQPGACPARQNDALHLRKPCFCR